MRAVVDANVFMRGPGPGYDSYLTVPEVMEELESGSSRLSFDTSSVEVREPSTDSIETVEQKSGEINAETSETDERLLALALELDEVIVTDDLGLQNLAAHLGVEFESYLGDEIEERRAWTLVCANCGREVDGEKCSACGSTGVERKPG
ncbi:MAG: DNA-binding protein [Candidatus Nanohaloarchaea archaeon]